MTAQIPAGHIASAPLSDRQRARSASGCGDEDFTGTMAELAAVLGVMVSLAAL
jgi:hypothetical protein